MTEHAKTNVKRRLRLTRDQWLQPAATVSRNGRKTDNTVMATNAHQKRREETHRRLKWIPGNVGNRQNKDGN